MSTRYYAFSPRLGRKLVEATTVDDAVARARELGAINLVREDGPKNSPTAIVKLWELHPKPSTKIMVWDSYGVPHMVEPAALSPVRLSHEEGP